MGKSPFIAVHLHPLSRMEKRMEIGWKFSLCAFGQCFLVERISKVAVWISGELAHPMCPQCERVCEFDSSDCWPKTVICAPPLWKPHLDGTRTKQLKL